MFISLGAPGSGSRDFSMAAGSYHSNKALNPGSVRQCQKIIVTVCAFSFRFTGVELGRLAVTDEKKHERWPTALRDFSMKIGCYG